MKSLFALLVICTFSFTANATKWVTGGIVSHGTCSIEYQICEHRFLSFDGCEVGDMRAIFDPANPDCDRIITNGILFL